MPKYKIKKGVHANDLKKYGFKLRPVEQNELKQYGIMMSLVMCLRNELCFYLGQPFEATPKEVKDLIDDGLVEEL